ncbi:ArnT family glycosyltransferase [Pseudolysinimonas sp.]|uniref:ArnT family glycosyltransferase n=1 Tax=Pseudolysinimonas sp. TaxID=2680009 RepID=UPI003F81BFBB
MSTSVLDRPAPAGPPTPPASADRTAPSGAGARLRRAARWIVRGRESDAAWVRPALLVLLVTAAVLYLWDLGASGWANSFYSAAVQAGSVNWEAFFYGSSDAGNSITVDKPPMSLWIMALSVRIFGLSSWSILVPEALMGVATVLVLYLTLRRKASPGIAILGGAILALTPVAALMFRFNNPDALLVLLMSLAAYFTVRGIESGRMRWIVWAGVTVGLGFLTKQLQAFLIVPPLTIAYLWASPARIAKRLLHLLAALGALVAAAGWWVAIVELVPPSMRPWIGGSQTNSFLELTFGYNGFGRLTGDETGSVTGGGGAVGGGVWGSTGILRLFENEIGGQITWLLPAALVLVIVGYVAVRRLPRISVQRAALTVFAGWMLVTAVAFSFMAGIFHAYYTVALAPAIAGVVAIGAGALWARRGHLAARIVMAALVLVTAGWAWVLLSEASTWLPALKVVVAIVAVVAAALLLLPPRGGRALSIATASAALVAALLAPTAYTLETVSTAHSGSIVTAGPALAGGMGGPGGRFGGARGGFGGAQGRGGQPPQGLGQQGLGQQGLAPAGGTGTGTAGGTGTTGGPTGGMGGGLLSSSTVSSALATALRTDSARYTWAAAAIGSNNAAGYQLATGLAVMPIGGFNGSDPSPTLAEFRALVAKGEIHWFIASGGVGGRANGGADVGSQIGSWVEQNFTATTVDGVTLYDLTARTGG